MSIFSRIRDLLSANINAMLDNAEDPEKMLNQIILDMALQKGPENYRKVARLGSYGSWIMYYICGLSFRVTDLQGRTAVFPWVKQEGGRCGRNG